MAYSYVDLVASAGQQNFPFSIPYLSRDHITVFQNGVLVDAADWTFLLAQTIRLDVGAALDDIIRVKRTTPIDEPIVDYSNGSVLGEAELDSTALQSLFSAQEVADSQADNIHMNQSLQWDALGFPIINLGAPVETDDAAQKGSFDSVVAATAASASAAAASASAASTSATNASNSASTASSQASQANTARVNAETAETNAELAETHAETAETNAVAAQVTASAAAVTAAAQASAAATSASAASSSASSAAADKASAATSASNASTSATSAANSAAKLKGTSTTSVTIGTGSKSFVTQSGKFFDEGVWLLITSDIDESNYMHGRVTSYSGVNLAVNVTNTGGSGTTNDWTIHVAGTRGAQGAAGGNTVTIQAAGSDVGSEQKVNFIEGAGIDLTVTDSPGSSRVDVTVAVALTDGDIPASIARDSEVTTEVSNHAAAADPHTGYQKESEKDAASGYAGLTAGSKIQNDAVVTASITDANVTLAKIVNVAADKLLGRGNGGGAGVSQEITLGTNLSLSGTTLNATINTTVTAYTSTDTLDDDVGVALLSGASFTFTLTTAVGVSGRVVTIRHGGTSLTQVYTIATTSAQTIAHSDGTNTTFLLFTAGEILKVISDGANWIVLDHYTETGWVDAGAITVGATTTAPAKHTTPDYDHCFWKRCGQNALVKWIYQCSASTGSTTGTGTYLFSLPTGLVAHATINPAVNAIMTFALYSEAMRSRMGWGSLTIDSSAIELGNIYLYTNTQVQFFLDLNGTPGTMSSTLRAFNQTEAALYLYGELAIDGWRA